MISSSKTYKAKSNKVSKAYIFRATYNDFDSDRLILYVRGFTLAPLASCLMVLPVHSQTNLIIDLLMLIGFDLQSIASLDLQLSVQESLALGVQSTNKHGATSFQHAEKLLIVDECKLASRRANQLKDLLP